MNIKTPFGLSSIIGTFTKTLARLEKFQKENGKKIIKMQNELHVKEREQDRALAIASNIKDFLDERDDSKSVSE